MDSVILNLTPYVATDQQEGLVEPETPKDEIEKLLTFESCPSFDEILERAKSLVVIAEKENVLKVLIDGPAYLIPVLQKLLLEAGFEVYYSFWIENKDIIKTRKFLVKTIIGWPKGFIKVPK